MYTDQYTLGQDATFRSRILVAVLKAAAAVQAEDPAGMATPPGYPGAKDALHALRSRLAAAAIADQATYAARFAAVVAADPATAGITANSSDDNLLFTVNSLWNTFSIGG